jgi:AraC family transcriptional regulator of adaptative response/methylated-DNA-[protein]-cysteine methyltransferase
METMSQEDRWKAVLGRDKSFDGAFVYAVRSTGIYCRPSCPARRPGQDQVSYFRMPEAAKQAGFLPCRRCRPDEVIDHDPQVQLIQRLCRYIENYDSVDEPLTLDAMGKYFQVSPYHLQRIFKRNMGITPKQFAEACRVRRLKGLFKNGGNVTSALYEAGYGSSSRLYEGASNRLGMTPGTYLRGGKGMRIHYTIINSSLGRLLVAATEKGISAVSIGKSDAALEGALFDEYPAAEIRRDETGLGKYVNALLKYIDGKQQFEPTCGYALLPSGTCEYCTIPGQTRSYAEVAETMGRPEAARAVAQACASNPTALVIPCHRVVRKTGHPGGYRWGTQTKRTLLAKEKIAAQPL